MPTLRYQILVRAREIITDKKNWTRFAFRRRYKTHTKYCAMGAMLQASLELTGSTYAADTYSHISLARLIAINDGIGHTAVLEHMDWLIEKEKKARKPSKPKRVASPTLVPALPIFDRLIENA
jgi:hypothetical protein